MIAFLVVCRYGVCEWAPPDRDVRLESKWPVLKPGDVAPNSAYDLLRRAAQTQPKESPPAEYAKEVARLNIEPWSETTFPVLTKLLQEDQTALSLARAAANAPNPQCVSFLSIYDKMDEVTGSFRLARIFTASAAQKAAAKDFAGAYSELETSMRFTQILSRGGVLIPTLVDIASESAACRAMRLIALRHDVPPDVAQRAIEGLLDTNKTTEPLGETFRAEYRAVPTMVDALFDPSRPDMFGLEKRDGESAEHVFRRSVARSRASKELANEDMGRVYKAIIEVADKPYRASEAKRLNENLVPKAVRGRFLFMRDRPAYFAAAMTVPALLTIIGRYPRRAADLEATALVLAIRQFQQGEGRLPSSLQELAPKYIAHVPRDPFDGEPFRFRVRPDGQWIVYSVGPNQIDENGEQPKKDPRRYDDPGDVVWCQCEGEKEH